MAVKKYAYLGLLTALAFVFSYVEFLIPIHLGIPGVKVGLANLVIIVAIYTIGEKNAFLLSIVRIILVTFTFGNLSAMIYSMVGAVLSFVVMLLAKKRNLLSVRGVSALGGVFHNVGQLLVAMVVLETSQLIYYLPVLMVLGTVSGVLVGILAALVVERIPKGYKPTVY